MKIQIRPSDLIRVYWPGTKRPVLKSHSQSGITCDTEYLYINAFVFFFFFFFFFTDGGSGDVGMYPTY